MGSSNEPPSPNGVAVMSEEHSEYGLGFIRQANGHELPIAYEIAESHEGSVPPCVVSGRVVSGVDDATVLRLMYQAVHLVRADGTSIPIAVDRHGAFRQRRLQL
jgi:hypothetical protein